jgi:hypothetical protein
MLKEDRPWKSTFPSEREQPPYKPWSSYFAYILLTSETAARVPTTPKAERDRREGRASRRGLKGVVEKKEVMKCALWRIRAAMLMQLAKMKPTLPRNLMRKREEVRKTRENRNMVRLYLRTERD